MFPGIPAFAARCAATVATYVSKHPQVVDVAKAAQGVSVVEIARERGRWQMVKDSRFNRRITAETPIDIGGPARGAALMRTQADPDGVRALGTFGNCAGGETPWGTYLTAEENIQDYFAQSRSAARRAATSIRTSSNRIVAGACGKRTRCTRGKSSTRASICRSTPTEPFRFGWIVEIDPRDPTRAPVKRTALGRFAHEGASPVIAHDGRVAVYMGDDDKFEYVYKFVSDGRFDREESARRIAICSIAARCTSRASMRAAGASGCRSCSIRRVR